MINVNDGIIKNMNIIRYLQVVALGLLMTKPVFGLTFDIPPNGDVVGEMQTTIVRPGESFGDISRRFDLGVYDMIEANPNIDPWFPPEGAMVVVPTQFILPQGPRVGLILNLAELRLYYFHPDKRTVTTHPIGLGSKKYGTPVMGQTTIVNKRKNPPWYPPDSIRAEHLAKNDPLPPFVAGGIPENPLGYYALYLSPKGLSRKGSFLIHGTNLPGGIGLRVTHGCIRLYPHAIEDLYNKVPIGTQVRIIHEPFKVGWHEGRLYLEAHQPFSEPQYAKSFSLGHLQKLIEKAISDRDSYLVNWTSAKMAAKTANGYPIRID